MVTYFIVKFWFKNNFKILNYKNKNSLLSNLIDARQTTSVSERFTGESGYLIDDIIKVCGFQLISGYLPAVDFEIASDSLNLKFFIVVLKKYGFGENFIDWIKILLRNQEFCVL